MTLRVLLIVASLLLPTPIVAQDIAPKWPIPDGIKWVPVNGYPMAYKEVGTGDTIVLVHGSASDYRVWSSQYDVFAKSHRVIGVSLRHFYPENWNGEGDSFSIKQHAADLVAFVKQLKLGRVHLLGHSRAGSVVVEVAKANPEVLRTLILEDGSFDMPLAETEEGKKSAEALKGMIAKLKEILKSGDKVKAAQTLVDTLNAPGAWEKTPDAIKEMILANIHSVSAERERPVTTCDDFRKFSFPVLLLTGENSPKRYPYYYGEMRKCKSFDEPIVIPKAAHGMHRQNAEAFNKAVLEFVAKN